MLAGARSVSAKELANRTKARRSNSRQSWRKPACRLARVRRRPIGNVARFLERRSEAAQLWRWSLKLRRQRRPLRPAAGSASLADGGLRRENWPPIGVMIRGSAAGVDQHFKGAIVIEPNLDRVWAALMAGAQPGRTPFTVLQLATSGLDGAPKVRSVILRSVDAEQGAVSFFTDLRSAKVEEIRHEPRVSLIGYDRGRRILGTSGRKGEHRHGGSGEGCGLGGLSISFSRALPASAAFRGPDRRSRRSCAR